MAMVAVVMAVLVGCGDDGTTLAEPEPGATAPPRTTPTTQAAVGTVASTTSTSPSVAPFRLSSAAFAEGGEIPLAQSCDGDNLSPPLAWGGMPPNTAQLAITVIDPDANNFVHWVVWGLDPTSNGIVEGALPPGARQANNQNGGLGWYGPCPPAGAPHQYVFTLHALNTTVELPDGADPAAALKAVEAASTSSAVLTGTFERN